MSERSKTRSRRVSEAAQASADDLKVYHVLARFNPYELNRFRKFVASPYFNRHSGIRNAFERLYDHLRSGNGSNITRLELWNSAFPNKGFDNTRFRKLCSDLLKLVEKFLAQEEFESNALLRADFLLQAVQERKMSPLYNSAVRTAERNSRKYTLRPASYYYHQYSFERSIYAMRDLDVERSELINVEEISQNLDKFYLAEKLRYYCYALVRQPLVEHKYDFLFIDEILEYIDKMDYGKIVPINFYYQVYLTQKDPEEHRHYEKLKLLIHNHIDELPNLEAKEIMDAAFNFCIRQINQGKQIYTREIFELYQESIRNDLIYINGILDPWNFRNIIVSGLRLGEYEWVEHFIEQYQSRLDEKYRANAVSFNTANLYFYQGRYGDVMQLLQEVEYEDPVYHLNSKAMLIATYYELDEIEPLISLLNSFGVYLRRRKGIPAQRRMHYQNLIKFVRALIRIPVTDKKALRKLRETVDASDGIVNKSWLLEKIDEQL